MIASPLQTISQRKRAAPLVAGLAVAASVATLGCQRGAPGLEWNEGVVKEIGAWRAKHEADYRRDWSTIEGLHFLTPGAHTAGSAANNDVVLTSSLPARIGQFTVGPQPGGGFRVHAAIPGPYLPSDQTAPAAEAAPTTKKDEPA